jgi:O-antigen ligase
MTRCIFLLGLPLGIVYLAWRRRRLLVVVFLPGAAIGIVLAPAAVRERIASIANPHSDIDSNEHRANCRIVGWQMVKAHPWFGLGPEQVGKQFNQYVASNVSRPLPRGGWSFEGRCRFCEDFGLSWWSRRIPTGFRLQSRLKHSLASSRVSGTA